MLVSEFFGYVAGFLIGLVMGLIGGGGSLLLPVFLYLFGESVDFASAYTLFLVGITAAIGVWLRRGRNEIDVGTGLTLAIPVLAGTLIARISIHQIPDVLFELGQFPVTKRLLVISIFTAVLLLSFASMRGWIGRRLKPNPQFRHHNPGGYFGVLIGSGLLIGLMSGYVGAGGGVLIVPLLVTVMGMPMKTVIGTSLAIMAFKSLLGFGGDLYQNWQGINWMLLFGFSIVMMFGILCGSLAARRIDGRHLREGFAWFILAMAVFMIVKETFFLSDVLGEGHRWRSGGSPVVVQPAAAAETTLISAPPTPCSDHPI